MEDNINQEQQQEQQEERTYTAEEVQALLQSEADKRVSSALKKQQKEYEKKLSLSKLDGAEREKAESANRISELEAKLADFQLEKNRSELKSVLSARGLSAEFADIINITDDLEASQQAIDTLDKLFKEAVKREVSAKLGESSTKPKSGTSDKLDAKKMSLAELNELYEKNPNEYKKLMGEM